MFLPTGVIGKEPAEIFHPRLIPRLDALQSQPLDQPAREVVTIAFRIDEIIPRLGAVERGAVEKDFGLHGRFSNIRPASELISLTARSNWALTNEANK